jgi:hypothetical protein
MHPFVLGDGCMEAQSGQYASRVTASHSVEAIWGTGAMGSGWGDQPTLSSTKRRF